MKRPLFWSVVAYALGEVTYFYTKGIIQISIIFIMLICCALIYKKEGINNKKGQMEKWSLVFILMFIFGGIIPEVAGCNKQKAQLEMLGKYDEYTVFSYGQTPDNSISVNGIGVVLNIRYKDNKVDYYIKYIEGMVNECSSDEKFKILIYGSDESIPVYKVGDYVNLKGELHEFKDATNPGEFSLRDYYNKMNVFYQAKDDILTEGKVSMINKFYPEDIVLLIKRPLIDMKYSLIKCIELTFDEDIAGFVIGMILGEKSYIDDKQYMLYRMAGIAHILAISGLHISLVGGFIYKLLRRLNLGFVLAGIISTVFILMYGMMTGNSVATVRAVIMLSYWMLSQIVGRNSDTLTGMAIAAFVILLAKPVEILEIGMLISFFAMLGIVAATYIIKQLKIGKIVKGKFIHNILLKFASSIIYSLMISAFTFPIIVSGYYEYSLFSFAINLIVIPFVAIIIVLSVLAILIVRISPSLSMIVGSVVKLIFRYYSALCSEVLKIPCAVINIGKVNFIQIGLYYVIVAIIILSFNKKIVRKSMEYIYHKTGKWFQMGSINRIRIVFIASLVLLEGIIFFIPKYVADEKIVFLDVGQGDCTLIKAKQGINLVVDGGSSSKANVGEYIIKPALKYYGMANVDYWFVTHMDADHVNGLLELLDQGDLSGVHIKNIVVSKYIVKDENFGTLIELSNRNRTHIIYLDVEGGIKGGDFIVNVLHPNKNFFDKVDASDANNMSLCFEYVSSKISILFTGDVAIEGLDSMANSFDKGIECYDLLKVPHHGSKNSLSDSFYSGIKFKDSVISCGERNKYGHPHEEILDVLADNKINIYRTDQRGAILVK